MSKWIQKALKKHHEGSLHRQLHIPVSHKIPKKEIEKIEHAHIGSKVYGHKVTQLLKKRAVLAETLRSFHHKHHKHGFGTVGAKI
jgi:hypothetical protein